MMVLMWSLGALLAGLFLGLRELLQLLSARSSGVIARKGLRDVRVRRDTDPESFARLLANRSQGATVGLGLAMIGALGLGLTWLELVGSSGPSAMVVFLAYFAFALFAGFCLVRGFATGRMFAVWSLTLFGDATLKQNPVWFWTYAGINLIIMFSGTLSLLGAATG